MKYVAYDYEEPGEPNNFWHIYGLDVELDNVGFAGMSLLTICAPDTPEMEQAIANICIAIDAAIDLADTLKGESQ